jgi:hypothetical protein
MAAFWSVSALAQDLIGQPTDRAIDLQPGVTPLREDAIFFHNCDPDADRHGDRAAGAGPAGLDRHPL